MAVPLAVTLLLKSARPASLSFYQPSLTPNVAMALWGRAASSAMPGRMQVAAITMFGAMRFGFRALVDFLPTSLLRSRWTLALVGCLVVTLCCVNRDDAILDRVFEVLTTCLAVIVAVLTADFVTRSGRADRVRKFDWIAVTALIAGLATPLYVPGWLVGAGDNQWWHPWLLPSHGMAFLVCLSGRMVRRLCTSKNVLDAGNR
jgi:hypothetical protein